MDHICCVCTRLLREPVRSSGLYPGRGMKRSGFKSPLNHEVILGPFSLSASSTSQGRDKRGEPHIPLRGSQREGEVTVYLNKTNLFNEYDAAMSKV